MPFAQPVGQPHGLHVFKRIGPPVKRVARAATAVVIEPDRSLRRLTQGFVKDAHMPLPGELFIDVTKRFLVGFKGECLEVAAHSRQDGLRHQSQFRAFLVSSDVQIQEANVVAWSCLGEDLRDTQHG